MKQLIALLICNCMCLVFVIGYAVYESAKTEKSRDLSTSESDITAQAGLEDNDSGALHFQYGYNVTKGNFGSGFGYSSGVNLIPIG